MFFPPLQHATPRRTLLAGALALLAACSSRGNAPQQPEATRDHTARDAAGAAAVDAGGPRAGAPSTTARAPEAGSQDVGEDDECAPDARPQVGAGWALAGFHPGPALSNVVALDRHTLAATTRRRVCTSDDGGEHWTERLAARGADVSVALDPLDDDQGYLVVGRRASGEVAELYLTRDRAAERWDAVTPPAAAGTVRAAFADRGGRLYVASDTRLFESDDSGANWSPPRTLPGRASTELDACGPVLIARARVDEDYFYHRSFDRGVTWRPFRLGAIGLEGNSTLLRCVTDRGGIEAGRQPLPSHWSFDGGRTWTPAEYDPAARTLARALSEAGARAGGEAPHCLEGPGRLTQCVDTGRLRLVATDGRSQEVHGPSSCERVRQVDEHRTFAFGPGCGVFASRDRGGLWRMVSQSLARGAGAGAGGTFAEGRGGFLDARTAWRIDGGVWWTFDGGASWRPFVSIGERTLDRGVFVDRRHGVFATSTGWVVATHDGGRHWTFMLRGEVERIASSRRAVMVTTTQSARVSPDGGVTWLAAGALPPQSPLDPTVEVAGARRFVAFADGARVVQQEGEVDLEAPGGPPQALARGLPSRYRLLAAHEDGAGVDRVLLEGGAVLARGAGGDGAARPRGRRMVSVRHGRARRHRGR